MVMDSSESYKNRMGVWDKIYEYPTGNTIPPQPDMEALRERMVIETSDMWTRVKAPGEGIPSE